MHVSMCVVHCFSVSSHKVIKLTVNIVSYISFQFLYVCLYAHKCQCIYSCFKVKVNFSYHYVDPGTKTHDTRIMGQIYHSYRHIPTCVNTGDVISERNNCIAYIQ